MTTLRFILTDPDVWGDPDVFRPARFLEAGADDLPNPMTLVFGYGKRYARRLFGLIPYSPVFVH
jgi:cytochrome P450